MDSVAACLADEEADVHNLTQHAVEEDALGAALRLTALAAYAIEALAAATGVTPEEVTGAALERMATPQIIYPAEMTDFDWAMTASKGWIEVTVRYGGRSARLSFYDPARLAQATQDELARTGYFAERGLVVVPAVTRAAIETTVGALTQRGFAGLDR